LWRVGSSLSSSETVYAVITEIIWMGFELEGDVEGKIFLKKIPAWKREVGRQSEYLSTSCIILYKLVLRERYVEVPRESILTGQEIRNRSKYYRV